jgi:riboflavin synthase
MTLQYAVVDTTFAVVNMGDRAVDQLQKHGITNIVRCTVPGFKDLGAACRQLLDGGADIAVACGMVGAEDIDKQCSQDASFGLQMCQQLTGKHVLEVFVHMDETEDPAELIDVVDNRVREHATNAYWLLEKPEELAARAGTGQRQGFEDTGSLEA